MPIDFPYIFHQIKHFILWTMESEFENGKFSLFCGSNSIKLAFKPKRSLCWDGSLGLISRPILCLPFC